MEIFLIPAVILIAIFFFLICVSIYDKIFGTSHSCRMAGWHNGRGKGKMFFDGCSVHATCSKCGKEVMQDGQGNWF